jgi:hypothetical protein
MGQSSRKVVAVHNLPGSWMYAAGRPVRTDLWNDSRLVSGKALYPGVRQRSNLAFSRVRILAYLDAINP